MTTALCLGLRSLTTFQTDYPLTTQQLYCGLARERKRGSFKGHTRNGNSGLTARKDEQTLKLQQKWGSDVVQIDDKVKKGSRKLKAYDINPVIKIPIAGI